jgi:hypothetical protein
MSVLVVIFSETRASELTFSSFKKHLLDVYNADLALCVGNNSREDISNPFYKHAKYQWVMEEPADFGDYLSNYIYRNFPELIDSYKRLYAIKYQFLGGIKESGHPGSSGILLSFRDFLIQNIIKEKICEKYDTIIITRSDYIHCLEHPALETLDPDKIYFPDGERYGDFPYPGLTDRHIICPSKYVIRALSILETIFSDFENNLIELERHKDWNLEKLIYWNLGKCNLTNNIAFFPYIFYTVRPVDGHTTWGQGYFSNRRKYYIKYPTEFESAMYFKLLNESIFLRPFKKKLVNQTINPMLFFFMRRLIWRFYF